LSIKNDQVFPVSLSEIAFILIFLLMLLLGAMVLKEQKEKEEAQSALIQVQSAETATQAMQQANKELTQTLKAGGHTVPSDVITQLVEASQVRADRDQVRQQLKELNDKITALEEIRDKIEKYGSRQGEKVLRDEVELALQLQVEVRKLVQEVPEQNPDKPKDGGKDPASQAPQLALSPTKPLDNKQAMARVKHAIAATNEFRQQVKDKLDRNIKPGDEPIVVREVIAAAEGYQRLLQTKDSSSSLQKRLEDTLGQVKYLTDKYKLRGVDHPPCWVDSSGRIEYLFTVDTRPNGFMVSKAWLPHREQDAQALPNIAQALAASTVSTSTFFSAMQPILNWSKKQDPECRHFVYLTTTILDADARDNARKLVEGFFYKYEIKR
jgi:hypothetical protein